jgi:hypothetical protein
MSDVSNGPGWWQASDGKWYPPEQQPNYEAPPAPAAGGASSAPSSSPSHRPASSSFSFDMKRWSQVERITSIASLVLFISLFLPWFTYNYGYGSVSVDGLWHGWMYIVFILSLAIVVHFVLKAGMKVVPYKLPLPEMQLLLIATGVNAVLTIFAFLLKPGGIGFSGIGWGFGSFIGLIAALVAAFPTAVPAFQARRK